MASKSKEELYVVEFLGSKYSDIFEDIYTKHIGIGRDIKVSRLPTHIQGHVHFYVTYKKEEVLYTTLPGLYYLVQDYQNIFTDVDNY